MECIPEVDGGRAVECGMLPTSHISLGALHLGEGVISAARC